MCHSSPKGMFLPGASIEMLTGLWISLLGGIYSQPNSELFVTQPYHTCIFQLHIIYCIVHYTNNVFWSLFQDAYKVKMDEFRKAMEFAEA